MADRLEQKGLVSRKVNAQDKRARILALTEEGEALVAALKPLVEQLQADILPGLDKTEYQLFIELAAKAARTAGSVG